MPAWSETKKSSTAQPRLSACLSPSVQLCSLLRRVRSTPGAGWPKTSLFTQAELPRLTMFSDQKFNNRTNNSGLVSILLNPYLNTALSIYPSPHQVLLLLSLSKENTFGVFLPSSMVENYYQKKYLLKKYFVSLIHKSIILAKKELLK